MKDFLVTLRERAEAEIQFHRHCTSCCEQKSLPAALLLLLDRCAELQSLLIAYQDEGSEGEKIYREDEAEFRAQLADLVKENDNGSK